MNAFLMFLALTDIDRIALCMLAIMAVALAIVSMLAIFIYRNSKRPPTQEDDLIEELSHPPRPTPPSPAAPNKKSHADWEKDLDWWK